MGSADHKAVVLFLAILFVGAATTHISSKYLGNAVPSAVLLFFEGIIISQLTINSDLGEFTFAIDMWQRLDSELILYIFLPPLMFGETMTMGW